MATAKKTAPAKKTTAVATRNTGAVSVKAAIAAQIAKNAEKTAPATGSTIRISSDKQFVLPDGTETRDPLTLVIVDFKSMNRYYTEEYNEKNRVPPVCAAIGDSPINLVPFNSSPERQADTCKDCPQNQWDTHPNGRGGKACDNRRILAVLPPDADADTPMWLLSVSSTAIKGFDGYVQGLQSKLQTAPFAVTTEVSFDESAKYPLLKFGNPVALDEDAAEVFAARIDEANEMLSIEPDFSGYDATPKKPAGRAPVKKPATARR